MAWPKLFPAFLFLTYCYSLHSATSVKVAIIGGSTVSSNCASTDANRVTNGGCLPVTGPAAELGAFQFAGLSVGNVSASTLAPYDTVVLNVASSDIACDLTKLPSAARTALITWAGQNHKLIIYDSECQGSGSNNSLDYSWLPFPFTTANPGAAGANGVLTIVENSTLGSSVTGSPNFVDAADLSNNTDAVGDANVMTTKDAHWCVALSAKNTIGFTGPVHTYARYPALTDSGLIIYNGLDQDTQSNTGNANLRKVWVFELQQPFNPSGLPCNVSVAGITLTPATATNPPGTSHTVTATLKDQVGTPQPNITVTFSVTAGPNQGITGTCNPAGCKTGSNGQVTFTYTDPAGKTGTDTIQACFTPAGSTPICITASKTWQATSACTPGSVVTLTALPATGAPGQPTDVTVTLSQTPQPPCASAFQLDATFDPSKATFASARKGEALTAANKDVSVQLNGSTVTLVGSGINQNTIANGNVAYLTFNLNSGFSTGSTPVTLGRCLASDANAAALTTSCVNGSIAAGCTCDLNHDGVTNVSDVQLMINQVLGVTPATCDVNHDGAINIADVQKVINAALGLGCS